MFTPKPRLILVANGEPPPPHLLDTLLEKEGTLIALDGGLNSCLASGHTPELLLGDFDSIDPESYPMIPHHALPDQNKTDLEKALAYLDYEEMIVLGALGRRADHTYYNLMLLATSPKNILYKTAYETLFALPKEGQIQTTPGATLSLLPMPTVTHLKTEGLKWDLDGSPHSPISLSNIATRPTITYSYSTGHLLCSLPN